MHTQHISTGIKNLKGNEILAMIRATEEGTLVAIRPLCATLQINWEGQREKLASDPRFNCLDIQMVATDGKLRNMLCLPAEQVPMWINSINSNKVSAEKRQALLELHKFFGHALNEFARDRYVTKDQFDNLERKLDRAMALIEDLLQESEYSREEIARLRNENEALRKASGYRATAASYGMHAAREEAKLKH